MASRAAGRAGSASTRKPGRASRRTPPKGGAAAEWRRQQALPKSTDPWILAIDAFNEELARKRNYKPIEPADEFTKEELYERGNVR